MLSTSPAGFVVCQDQINIVVQKSVISLLLMMISLVGFVRVEAAKEMVVGSVKELKDVKTKKVTWKKDRAKMVLLTPGSFTSGEIGKRKDQINSIFQQ